MALTQEQLDILSGKSFVEQADLPGEAAPIEAPIEQPEPTPEPPPPAHVSAIDSGSRAEPNEVIETIRLGQELDMPAEAVLNDPKEARRLAHLQSLGIVDMPEQSPGTTKWLSNPQNAAIANDDIKTLQELERQVDAQKGFTAEHVSNAGKSWVIGLAKMWPQFQMMMHGASEDTAYGYLAKQRREEAQAAGDLDALAWLDENEAVAERTYQESKSFVEEADKLQAEMAPKDAGILTEGVITGITMGMDMIPGLMISAATRGRVNPTLPFLTAKTGLDSYSSAILEGRDHTTAMRYGGIDAAIENLTERLPTKYMEKLFGELGKDGIKGSLKRWMVMEGGTEQIATFMQSMNAVAFELDHELANAKTLAERVEIQARRQAVTLVGTIVGGGGMSLGISAVDRVMNKESRAQREALQQAFTRTSSENSQNGLDQIISLAQASKTNERAQEFFEDFMNSVGAEETIYISAEVLEELKEAPDSLLSQIDGSGGTVEMTMGAFLTEFANQEDQMALLRDHIKVQPHLQTKAEMTEDTDTGYIQAMLEKAVSDKQAKEESEAIFDEIKDMLKATGRQGELTSSQSAALYPAMIATQYENLKAEGKTNPDGSEITIRQLYEDMGFRIAKPSEVVGAEGYVSQEAPNPIVDRPVGENVSESVANVQSMLNERTEPGEMPGTSKIMNNESGSEQDYALIELSEGIAGLRIETLIANRPGKGSGRAALNTILDLADQQLVSVTVEPKAMKRVPGMTDAELEQWFERNGFEKQGPVMVRAAAPEMPGLLYDQAFGNIQITETVVDEAGNYYDIETLAQKLWQEQQQRFTVLQNLRGCANG